MLKFVIKNLMSRKSKVILSIISILIATTIFLVTFNMAKQIDDGIVNTAGYYDVLIGPSGSDTDLVLNTMFFTSNQLGTIEYDLFEEIKESSNVNIAIPFATGDSYKGAKIVGTIPDFLKNYKIKQGKLFENSFETVIGSNIAKQNNLKIGDTFIGTHGYSESGHQHENNPYTIVGILDKTNTAYDNTVFTTIDSVWISHGHEHEEGEEIEEHEHKEGEKGDLTAILVKSKNLVSQNEIIKKYNETNGVQAINPTTVLRKLVDSIDTSKTIIYFLCIIIGILSFIIIYITTLLILEDSKKDIKLLRLIGINRKRIFIVLFLQNLFISVFSIIISILMSKITLAVLGNITKSMGIVINYVKIYPIEIICMFAVLIISLIPSIMQVYKIYKEDPIYEK